MLTKNNQGWLPFDVVVNVNNNIDPKVNIFAFKGILLVPENCIIIGFVNIVIGVFELVQKFSKGTLIQTLLKFLKEITNSLLYL